MPARVESNTPPSSTVAMAINIVRDKDGVIDVDAWDELVQGAGVDLVPGLSIAELDVD